MSSWKVDILQMNESTVLDDDVYIPGFKKVRKIGQLTEGTEVVYVQMCALIWTIEQVMI